VFTYVYFEPDYGPTYFEPVFYADKERCPAPPSLYSVQELNCRFIYIQNSQDVSVTSIKSST
jgi:hypothetical protein